MSQPKPRPAQRTESISAFSRRNFLSSMSGLRVYGGRMNPAQMDLVEPKA